MWPTVGRSYYLGQLDIGDDHNINGTRGVLRRSAGIAAGVVLVLALCRIGLPRHAVFSEGDGVLGG